MKGALGLIEVLGMATAVTVLDAACKNANVKLVGCNKVIGAGKAVSVTVQIAGDVSAVKSAVDAGVDAGSKVGKILAAHVIPRPHEEVQKLFDTFNAEFEKKTQKKSKKQEVKIKEEN